MADRFNDIPGLVWVFNTGEVAPETTAGTFVGSWSSSETPDGEAINLMHTFYSGSTQSTYVRAGIIGAMTSIAFTDNSNRQALQSAINSMALSNGYTLAVLMKHGTDTRQANRYSVQLRRGGSTGGYLGESSSQTIRAAGLGSVTAGSEQLVKNTTDPEILYLGVDSTADSGFYYTDNTQLPTGPQSPFISNDPAGEAFDELVIGCQPLIGGLQCDFDVSIVALYDHKLTVQEREDLLTLMAHWRDNNSAPNSDTPPSVDGIVPASETVDAPNGFSFQASVSGQPTPTVQWDLDGTPISGATNPLYAQASTSMDGSDAGVYRITASSSGGPDAFGSATLIVNTPVYPTTCTFGPAKANDASATLAWECNIAGNAGWALVSDTPALLATERAGNAGDGEDVDASYLDINAATADQTGTLVRCKATTDYNSGGIVTETNTLNVVGA